MRRLGKGLNALVGDEDRETLKNAGFDLIEIDNIKFNPYQPRKDSSKQKVQELADSIEENGIIQPVVVRKIDNGKFELIAGERRITAAQLAGLGRVPAVIRDAKSLQMLSLAIIENVQRENLNTVDQALAFKKLVDEFGKKQGEIAKLVGKSRVAITNTLRLLKLPNEILDFIRMEKITSGHARAVLQVESDLQMEFAQTIIDNSLSVHQAEMLAKRFMQKKTKTRKLKKDVHLVSLEDELSKTFGANVKINGQKKGKIEIQFFSEDELNNILQMLFKLRNL
ncbi:MAG: ParB/RepB/Spo0J family partition protein [Candidatus Cloacimonadota bacterium]|nr:ParB/RepB/Spo0J family partition protein [Candidatus Cloacimonadota bacterium]